MVRVNVPFKDLIILGTFYGIAIYHRKTTPIHARAMIATGIVFIEPSLLRIIRNYFEIGTPYIATAITVYVLLLFLTIVTWKYKKGRWIFPLMLFMYLSVQLIMLLRLRIGVLEHLAK
ncbi:hypothetical protein [Allomuricauda sp. NBRC 101325]|uniref:hypothetical protein n=1 Tax=Allomuricauda sp. NBRC 101325 TaxID=1113758 RepID=UPI002554A9C9|nr:hypothetical protein [Muricauda sp. NBRC 101325]